MCPWVPLQTPLFSRYSVFCARFEILISVLKMVFHAVILVLPKFRMSLLGLHLKGPAVLDWIVLPILNVCSPVATERCWCRLMTWLCGVASTNRPITSERIRDFIFSVLYNQKSCFGIQSYLLLSFACAVQYSRWTRQYWSTVIGSQNIFFVPFFDLLPLRVYECA